MKYLLDTHILLWYFQEDNRLSDNLVNLLEDSTNNLYLSIVSLWEIAIKINIGKLRLDTSFQNLLIFIDQLKIEILPITTLDVESYVNLPLHHRDPFDRILVAQAVNNQLILISCDPAFDNYSIQRLW
jgi:PIN domain nuclease of toxin-antitoxin system